MPLQPLVSCWHTTLGPTDTTSANMSNTNQAFLSWDHPHDKLGLPMAAQAMPNMSPNSPFANCLHDRDKQTHSRTSPHLWWAWTRHQMMARFPSSQRRVSMYSRKQTSSSHAKGIQSSLASEITKDNIEYPRCNNKAIGNLNAHPNKHRRHCAKPTVSTIYHQPSKQSNGCMPSVDIQSNWLGSKPSKLEIM